MSEQTGVSGKILVVGAGFTGAVIARQLAEAGYKVDVIERRGHVAGNAYDYQHEEEHGNVRVHKYGPHIFHTKNKRVFDYLSKFTKWVPYNHRVKARLEDGRHATLPVNKETKEMVGEENVLDIFFRPYTLKMWGIPLDELNPDIINRIPIRDDDNDLYFPDDTYQKMPEAGYTSMIHNILAHQNITLSLNTEFYKRMETSYNHVFNSMPIDVYYDFQYGELPYRSIKFHIVERNKAYHPPLPSTTVNFTHSGKYTRMTDWQKFPAHGTNTEFHIRTFEEPCDYKDNNDERYYPVKDLKGENRAIYQQYRAIDNPKTTFVGRCGTYAYIDMDQAVNMALQVSEKFLKQ